MRAKKFLFACALRNSTLIGLFYINLEAILLVKAKKSLIFYRFESLEFGFFFE